MFVQKRTRLDYNFVAASQLVLLLVKEIVNRGKKQGYKMFVGEPYVDI